MKDTTYSYVVARSGITNSLIIFLHGYGANGQDLLNLAPFFTKHLPNTACIAPDAPEQCAANPQGYQWFPVSAIDGSSALQMEQSFTKNTKILSDIVERSCDTYNIQTNRVALVGFSQGTMASLQVATRHSKKLAGVIGFSGKLLFPESLHATCKSKPEVVLIHGDKDMVVLPEETILAERALKKENIPVTKHMLPGVAHTITPDGIQIAVAHVKKWLND